ncbi:NAD-dependent epimerase/dehydratase family protein [Chloroflexota bacterium]
MKRKVLICGITGFIGRNIAESMVEKNEYEVYGTYLNSVPIEDTRIKLLQADLTNKDDVNRIVPGMDIIIQAAATTSGAKDIFDKPYYHVTDNVVMNSLIFRTAHEHKVSHMVYFSCTVMYQSSDMPVKETDFNANQEIYPNYFGIGWTKVYIEKMCEFYSRIGNTKYTAIRHSNIYGPYDKYDLERSHVFGATMTKVLTSKDGDRIVVWGGGEEERDLLYISDLVDFVETVIKKQGSKYELYNVGIGNSISVNNLVQKIIASSGKDISVENDFSKPSIKTIICLDTTKAKQSLGWSPQVSLDEGIQKTLDWYRTNMMN